MRKLFYLLFVILLSFTIVGCDGSSHEGEAKTPSGSSIQNGRDYLEVIKDFEENGFTNIETEKIDDLIFGWLTKEGEVEEVLVGGDVNYESDDWLPADTAVLIRYHVFPERETEEITETNDSEEETETNETDQESITSEDNTVIAEVLDLNAINNTNSIESDAQFIGKIYKINGTVSEAMDADEYSNALIIIHPNVMAKGMASSLPLDFNVWLTAEEFEKIGGISSVGKSIEISAELVSIARNAISSDTKVKGYPIELEFGNYK